MSGPRGADAGMKGIAGAVLWHADGVVLLQHRDDEPHVSDPGKWSLFGGAIEPGEDPVTAMLREVDEEIGYRPRHYHPFVQLRSSGKVFHFFLVGIDVPVDALTLTEGQGMAYVEPAVALADYELSAPSRTVLGMLEVYRAFRADQGSAGPL